MAMATKTNPVVAQASYGTQSAQTQTGTVQKKPTVYTAVDDPITGNSIGGIDLPYQSPANYNQIAAAQVNPTYDALRLKQEQDSSANRELIPQIMAARYGGIMGTKGGRTASAMTRSVQNEGAAINQIEGDRQRAVSELSRAMASEDRQATMQMLQLAMQKEQNEASNDLAERRLSLDEENSSLDRKLQYDMMNMDDKQFQMTYGINKAQADQQIKESNYNIDQKSKEWAWQTDPTNWQNTAAIEAQNLDNDYKKAQISKLLSSGSGGGGSSLTQTERNNLAKSEVFQGILDEINAGTKYEGLVNLIKNNSPGLIAMGVDPTVAQSYLDSVYDTGLKDYEAYQAAGGENSIDNYKWYKPWTWGSL